MVLNRPKSLSSLKANSFSDLNSIKSNTQNGRKQSTIAPTTRNSVRSGGLRQFLNSDPAKATRSSSVKDLSQLFDAAPTKRDSFNDVRSVFNTPSASVATSNDTFNAPSSPTRGTSSGQSRGLVIMQKRLQEYCEKLRNQEARHNEERLTWQAQKIELERLRKEREVLLKEKNEREMFAQEIQEEREAVDWAKQIEILKELNKSKDQQIGCLKAQLDEKIQELDTETELNTDTLMELQGHQSQLVRENSQKDLKIGELEEQLKFHNSKGSSFNFDSDDMEDNDDVDEADEGCSSTADLLSSLPVEVTTRRGQPSYEAEHFSQGTNDSKEEKHIEDLKAKLSDSQSKLDFQTKKNKEMESKIEIIENKWKSEVERAKVKNKEDLDAVRDKLLSKLAQIHKERKELQKLKRGVLCESAKVVTGMTSLQDLIEELQEKIIVLEKENPALKDPSIVVSPTEEKKKKKKTKLRSKSQDKSRSKSLDKSRNKTSDTEPTRGRRKLKRKESVSKLTPTEDAETETVEKQDEAEKPGNKETKPSKTENVGIPLESGCREPESKHESKDD